MIRTWGLLLCLVANLAFAAELISVNASRQSNKTSLYLTIKGHFTHHVFSLSNPNRIVLDLTDTTLIAKPSQFRIPPGLITGVRCGKPNAHTLRLVFDTNQSVNISSFPWRSTSTLNGIRVELWSKSKQTILIKTRNRASSYSSKNGIKSIYKQKNQPITAHKTPVQALHVPSLSFRDVVVVLDAGHGGKDPGAKGPSKSREKDVVLAITLQLKQLIDRQPGMHAVLTRSGDYYVGLRDRLHIARKYNGDVFVSIHADAFKNPHSHGASVFALSQRGATSEAARWLAEKENYSELGGVNLRDLDDKNGLVRSVLIDLSQTATINSGLVMGRRVLNQMQTFAALHNNKVEQARFMVLKSPDIPSILVETGFISNPQEERNLTSVAYQRRLCQAIFQGIKTYFWESPPHGSRIEAMTTKANRFHVVRSGDSLSSIARDYHVSIAALQTANKIWLNSIKPGQKLMIPSAWS